MLTAQASYEIVNKLKQVKESIADVMETIPCHTFAPGRIYCYINGGCLTPHDGTNAVIYNIRRVDWNVTFLDLRSITNTRGSVLTTSLVLVIQYHDATGKVTFQSWYTLYWTST